jgi:hypothetical protein
MKLTPQIRATARTAFHVEHMFDCTLFHVEHGHHPKSNLVELLAAFAQDSSFCTQLCVAFEVEWHYSAPISGFSKN